MFGSDYLLGYSQGRSSAEDERETNALVARVIYGRRPVLVDQSYLDQLHQVVQKFRADSDHNFDKADLFHREALEWKADAERHEAHAAALEAEVAALQAQLADAPPAIRRRRRSLRSGPPIRRRMTKSGASTSSA